MADKAVVFPAAGRKERRVLAFDAPQLAEYEWPYTTISGAYDGPTLCLTAGIHGAEYPPIDAVLRFCQALDPARLRGRVVAVPVINLPAFWERTPFVCPRDGKNPNRCFPGDASGTFTEALTYSMFQTVFRQGDYLVDLHCGDLVEDLAPFTLVQRVADEGVNASAVAMARAFGLAHLIVQAPSGGPVAGTTVGAAAEAGIPAILPEAGGIGQLQPDAVALHLRGLERLLQHVGMLEGVPAPLPPPVIMREFVWVRAEQGGFFRKAVAAGDHVSVGSLLGQVVDLYGDLRAEISSPCSGVVLFSTTSPAMQDGGLVAGIGVPE